MNEDWLHMNRPEYSKLEWMDETSPKEADENQLRFDFSGRILSEVPEKFDSSLYHHSGEPNRAGYSLDELVLLAQSSYPAQRVIAWTTISAVLKQCLDCTNYPREQAQGVIEWILQSGVVFLLRWLLDEGTKALICAAVDCLYQLIVREEDEAFLDSLSDSWLSYSFIFGISVNADSESPPEVSLVKKDVIEGLLEMNILPRLTYLFGVKSPNMLESSVELDHFRTKITAIFIRIARNSKDTCAKISQCPYLVESLMECISTSCEKNNLILRHKCRLICKIVKLFTILSVFCTQFALDLDSNSTFWNCIRRIYTFITTPNKAESEPLKEFTKLVRTANWLKLSSEWILWPMNDDIYTRVFFYGRFEIDLNAEFEYLIAFARKGVEKTSSRLDLHRFLTPLFYAANVLFNLAKGDISLIYAFMRELCEISAKCKLVEFIGTKFQSLWKHSFYYDRSESPHFIKGLPVVLNKNCKYELPCFDWDSSPISFLTQITQFLSSFTSNDICMPKLVKNMIADIIDYCDPYIRAYSKSSPPSCEGVCALMALFESKLVYFIIKLRIIHFDERTCDRVKLMYYECAGLLLGRLVGGQQDMAIDILQNMLFSEDFLKALKNKTGIDDKLGTFSLERLTEIYAKLIPEESAIEFPSPVPLMPGDWLYAPLAKGDLEDTDIVQVINFVHLAESRNIPFLCARIEDMFCHISSIFVNSMVFHDESISACLTNLIDIFNLKTNNMTDYEFDSTFDAQYVQLLENYSAVSYSEFSYTLCILSPCRQNFPVKYRQQLWSTFVSTLYSVRLSLSPSIKSYLWPKETNVDMIAHYFTAMVAKNVTLEQNEFMFAIALHHVNVYVMTTPLDAIPRNFWDYFTSTLMSWHYKDLRDIFVLFHKLAISELDADCGHCLEFYNVNDLPPLRVRRFRDLGVDC